MPSLVAIFGALSALLIALSSAPRCTVQGEPLQESRAAAAGGSGAVPAGASAPAESIVAPIDEEKRAWNNLGSAWGKRGWRDLNGGWGKRGWQDLSGGWGKRGWQDLNGGWGKRAWQNLQSSWGKRAWDQLRPGWGKRAWDRFHGSWGKRSDLGDGLESNRLGDEVTAAELAAEAAAEAEAELELARALGMDEAAAAALLAEGGVGTVGAPGPLPDVGPEREVEGVDEDKRAWKSLGGSWGKRRDWGNFQGPWDKRDPGWNNLKGLWGKRVEANKWNRLSAVWGKR